MLASGVLIDERYRVDAVLGRGGTSDVFRSIDTHRDRPVALKVLRLLESAHLRRFQAEIDALRRLDHPGVVHLEATGCHGEAPYLVLELVDGRSLADEMAEGPMGQDRCLAVGMQLAEALAHAHQHGIVHRDVKPANVLVDDTGRVCLTDFGIARMADSARMTATGHLIGTAPYLAPEQIVGERAGPPADVYALGLVLIECLSGERCYPGGVVESAMARLHRQPEVPAGLPGWFREVLVAMTARNPERRPEAEAVAVALLTRSADPVSEPTQPVPIGVPALAPLSAGNAGDAGDAGDDDELGDGTLARDRPFLVVAVAAAVFALAMLTLALGSPGRSASDPTVDPAGAAGTESGGPEPPGPLPPLTQPPATVPPVTDPVVPSTIVPEVTTTMLPPVQAEDRGEGQAEAEEGRGNRGEGNGRGNGGGDEGEGGGDD